MIKNSINFVLLDDIEEQLTDIFTATEIINLTKTYGESLGKEVPITIVHFNSKKSIINSNLDVFSVEEKKNFLRQLKEHSKVKQNINLCKEIDDIISGDNKEVTKSRKTITDMLKKYPSGIINQWQKSCDFFENADYRNALDNIRLTIELLVKDITNSNASLENQKATLGNFFKDKGISKEFRNLFFKMLDMYEKIQNHNAKHDIPQKLSKKEIKLLMNQSTVIIKFLIECDKGID